MYYSLFQTLFCLSLPPCGIVHIFTFPLVCPLQLLQQSTQYSGKHFAKKGRRGGWGESHSLLQACSYSTFFSVWRPPALRCGREDRQSRGRGRSSLSHSKPEAVFPLRRGRARARLFGGWLTSSAPAAASVLARSPCRGSLFHQTLRRKLEGGNFARQKKVSAGRTTTGAEAERFADRGRVSYLRSAPPFFSANLHFSHGNRRYFSFTAKSFTRWNLPHRTKVTKHICRLFFLFSLYFLSLHLQFAN